MRAIAVGLVLSTAAFLPTTGHAQVYDFRTPPPEVTAASSMWQINSEPIVHAGLVYCPTSARVFFNPLVMQQVGVYRGVPLYADTTLEPYSLVFVPVGGYQMRQYERPRAGWMAGTVGSRTPSFPVQLRYNDFPYQRCGCDTCGGSAGRAWFTVPVWEVPRAAAATPAAPAAPVNLRSIPMPESNQGVWIEFGGARWHNAGTAVSFEPGEFTRVGEYHGFPVYRAVNGPDTRIYVPVVIDGALTPYDRG
ncbi:MAG: hypothetical protein ACM3SQ_03535 [Betaproteobacteria bacterium]